MVGAQVKWITLDFANGMKLTSTRSPMLGIVCDGSGREKRRRDVAIEVEAAAWKKCLATCMSVKAATEQRLLHQPPTARTLAQQLACANIHDGTRGKTLCRPNVWTNALCASLASQTQKPVA